MVINNSLGQDGGTGTQVLRSNGGAIPSTFEDVETCGLPIITGATYATIGGFNIAHSSSGVITGMTLSDGGSGTVDIASGTMFIRTTASDVGDILSANFAGATGVALTDNSINFVFIDYNSGTPQPLISTTPSVTPQDNVVVGIVWREGTTLYISEVNVPTPQVSQKLSRRLVLVEGVTRQSGIITGETGTREITITAGAVWLALADYSLAAFDSSAAGTWIYYFRDGSGGWTAVTSSTQINNTQYDDNSGSLATLSNNQFGVHWVYQSIASQIYVLYGQDTYTLTEAQDALVPATSPLQITNLHTILIAKIIIEKNAAVFTEILLPWDSIFAGGLASAHNDLSGIQGGAANDYFHFTEAQHDALAIPLVVASGGTGLVTIPDHAVMLGSGTAAVSTAGPGTVGQILVGVTGADPTFATQADGDFTFIKTVAGTRNLSISNTNDDNAGSKATVRIIMGGIAGGLPYLSIEKTGNRFWAMGMASTTNEDLVTRARTTTATPATGTECIRMSPDGEINMVSTPAFLGILSATDDNVTGDNTSFTVGSGNVFTEIFDQGGDFVTTGTFTSPVSGRYFLEFANRLNATSGGTDWIVQIITSNRTYQQRRPPIVTATSLVADNSVVADMDAADTSTYTVQLDGVGADTSDVIGGTTGQTRVSGKLLC